MKFCQATALILLPFLVSCSEKEKSIGSIERIDLALDAILSANAKIEIIGEGFEWSEGPVWIAGENMLLFSDVPKNTIYKWTEAAGVEVYLTPSGFTGDSTTSPEPGSNGLLLDDEGNLVLCQHGDRRLAVMNADLNNPQPEFTSVAETYNGKRFSSPNDAVLYNYDFYFTDPPYGLKDQDKDAEKEILFQGVYKATANGNVVLLVDSLTRPNGIAFTPDRKMIVANSDRGKARWYEYALNDSVVVSGKVLYDATTNAQTEKGLPDGLKIDRSGNIFATGPGGVWIFNASGKLLGKINVTEATSNCALADDDKTLYVTADMYVLKIKLRE
jgi:gluconolactonase